MTTANETSYQPYMPLIDALLDKHAINVTFLDLNEVSGFTDAFVVATARSEINAKTLTEAATDALESLGLSFRTEGAESASRWCLIDAGDIVVHIFSREGREFYNIERLWADAPVKTFEDID